MKISDLFEARPEHIKFKETKTKGVVTKITAILSGKDSAKFTRIAKQYKTIGEILDDINFKRNKINEKVKEMFPEYFDIEDEIYTRVIETAQATLTLSKGWSEAIEAKEGEKVVKYEELLDELYEMGDGSLKGILDNLKEKYTVIGNVQEAIPAKKIPTKLSKPKVRNIESIEEADNGMNIVDRIKSFGKKFKSYANKMLSNYDSKLDNIEFRLNQINDST